MSCERARIAIVGGGLGGLTCARVLQLAGRRVTVFERETSPAARGQGGTLDMHADTGQRALRDAGLYEQFQALARPEGQEVRLLDRTATLVRHALPGEGDEARPEIDRGQLRGLILDALLPGTVRWGRSVSRVDRLDDRCRLHFPDGGSEEFDLVVGADGAWSRVRPAVSDATPDYTGVTFLDAAFDDVDHRRPALAELVGQGMMLAKADGKALFVQRNSNSHLRAYIAFRVPLDWPERTGLDVTDTAAVRTRLLAMFDGWDPSLRRVLRDNDGAFIHRPLFALPVPHRWDATPGVTLLGDAAHLMPPLGLGANLAMLDGAELGRALVTKPDLDAGVRAYEAVMAPRSEEAARACGEGLEHLLPPVAEPEAAAAAG